MSATLNNNALIEAYKSTIPKSSFLIWIATSTLIGTLILFLFFKSINYYFLFAFAAPLIIYIFIKYPKVWLYILVLSLGHYMRDVGKGVSTLDVIYAFFLLGSLLSWFVFEIMVKKRKLFYALEDFLLVLFFLAALLNSLIAYFNDVDMFEWIREYIIISFILYYFPFRDHLKSKDEILRVLFLFSIATLIMVADQFLAYLRTLNEIQYAFELEISVRKNQTLFTAACTIGLALFIYFKKIPSKIYAFIFTALTLGALLLTFSRTFWLILLGNAFVMLIYFSFTYKIKLIAFLSIISVLLAGAVFLTLNEKADLFINIVENRFTSSTQGQKDPSIRARLAEYEYVVDKIEENPLGGNGLSKYVKFFNPIVLKTNRSHFIHNGYLFFIYRLGLPTALLFFISLLLFAKKSEFVSRKTKDDFFKILSVGCLGVMLLIILSNLSTTQWVQRDGTFVMAVTFAILTNLKSRLKENG